MRGNNVLQLNEATMIEAVQLWLASKFREGEAPRVTSVKLAPGATHAATGGGSFEVHVTDQPATA